MDAFLIVIILAIVIAIGYILSRPFISADSGQNTAYSSGNYAIQYQVLLSEIKDLEAEYQPSEDSDVVSNRLVEKKQQAAQLLRLIDTPLKDKASMQTPNAGLQDLHVQPAQDLLRDDSYICSQCGSQIKSSDKFCTYCGHRLQP